MIAPHTLLLTDEEVAVLCEALSFFASEYDPDQHDLADDSAVNRQLRIAEELGRRLPVAATSLRRAA